jgi:diguanylate cyclase (GGDEF)-like protein
MSEMSLDAPTLVALTAVVAITLGALIIFSWSQGRRDFYLALWGAGDIVGGIAAGLLFTRGALPDFLSINLANAILALAYGVMIAAAREFSGKKTPTVWISAGALFWLAACGFGPFYASQTARIVLLSTIFAAYSGWTAVEFWRGRRQRLASRIPAVICLFVHAAASVCRIPIALFGGLSAPRVAAGPWFALLVFEALIHVIAMAILVVSMAKERAELEQRVVASTDELTDVATRRAFLAEGEKRIAAARKKGLSVSLLLFDLDHFKNINDSFGHATGDQVLRAFADCATNVLRPHDLFGRIGGEEFAALLVGPDAEAAVVVAERTRRAVESIELGEGRATMQLSVSVGVATALRSARPLGEMLREADHALYLAKSEGRNRVEWFGPAPKLVA